MFKDRRGFFPFFLFGGIPFNPSRVTSATLLQWLYNSTKSLTYNNPTESLLVDSSTLGDDRLPQPGRGYLFDGVDDYIAFPHLVGTETVISYSGTGTPSISAGRLDCTAGTLWDVLLSDGTLLKCDEGDGITSYDSSGNANHGTITNATLGTFHATFTDGNGSDYQNTVGYSEAGSVFVPRDESNTDLDVSGNPLQYEGRVPYDSLLVESNCGTFDGIDDYIDAPHLIGTETVVSSGGTATPSISVGRIDFTAGTCWDLQLSDGTVYPIAEGEGLIVYDVSGNGNHGTVTNTTSLEFWANTQDEFHYNIHYGFTFPGNSLQFEDGLDALFQDGTPIEYN